MKKLLEKDEKDLVEKMKKNRTEIEEKLNDGREREGILHSVLETDQPDGFLQVQTNKIYYSLYTNQISNTVRKRMTFYFYSTFLQQFCSIY